MSQILEDTVWRDYYIVEYLAAHPNIPEAPPAQPEKDVADRRREGFTLQNVTSPNIWIMHPGSAVQARFAPYHTFRVQLQGVARYVLFSPVDVEKHAYIYPHTHLSHGQSQVQRPDLSSMLIWLFSVAND